MKLRARLGTWAASALLAVATASVAHDGPYVFPAADGAWRVVRVDAGSEGLQRRETLVKDDPFITVEAVGDQPSFRVPLRNVPAAREVLELPAKSPLFVVADTHGEYEILARQLREHGVIDDKLSWSFGRGHLIVLGDVLDRGPRQTEILWLLYKLEAEAAKARGGAHLVLGNHETMVLLGDLRYLHPRYQETTRVLGAATYSHLLRGDSLLGRWLRSRPTILRVNDALFLHGGVSRALADSGMLIAEINTRVRELLSGARPDTPDARRRAELLLGSLGPLWYRGYFDNPSFPKADDEDIAHALGVFGVRRIYIGHTVVPAITPLYGGRVIAVQVYPRLEADGDTQFENLLIRNGAMWRALPGGVTRRLELPKPAE
jgi:hypothetical protein